MPLCVRYAIIGLDLIDENDGVAHDHAGERDETEERVEAERSIERKQRLAGSPRPHLYSWATNK
jgi:hypothetical protein